MAAVPRTKIATVKVIDSRVEPQPEPVYVETESPLQNQFYKIPASSCNNNNITFNNLTTLGANRAYLDTFEIEMDVTLTFEVDITGGPGLAHAPRPYEWLFRSFPFNRICDNARVNINGGTFFSSPLAHLPVKERYWKQEDITDSYQNHTPCCKAHVASELGVTHPGHYVNFAGMLPDTHDARVRIWHELAGGNWMEFDNGPEGTWNNSIVRIENYVMNDPAIPPPAAGQPEDPRRRHTTIRVVWREPIFCSPFSSKIDATYGRPLYNITSLDMSFDIMDPRQMIILASDIVTSFDVHINNAQICYQVLTVPETIHHDVVTVPYRRYVPFIASSQGNAHSIPGDGLPHEISTSPLSTGVYTLNEVPTAIWLFIAPVKAEYQKYTCDFPGATFTNGDHVNSGAMSITNKSFGFIDHISLSVGNTTQILSTAEPLDLYRISKANGCQDSFQDWSVPNPLYPTSNFLGINAATGASMFAPMAPGMGSVIRLIPGTDIVIPGQPLIPGSNAHNAVFKAEVTGTYVNCTGRPIDVCLWVLFEYVGVAAITPTNCSITMNPLGDIQTLPSGTPVLSSTQMQTISTLEGAGWLDKLKQWFQAANKYAKDTKIASRVLKQLAPKDGPSVVGEIAEALDHLGYGYSRPRKKGVKGGAIMGMGDFC